MRPHVICHMLSSIDGRILPSRWEPKNVDLHGAYERIHEELDGDAWIVGRVTGQEFAKARAYATSPGHTFPRTNWIVTRESANVAVVLDAHGKIVWGRSDIGGDPLVVVLTEQVSDSHLAGLRADGVSYIFAGKQEIDLGTVLEVLNREFQVKRLLLEGGGHVNGGFLRAGLVDEISVIVAPAVDGKAGAPSTFDGKENASGIPVEAITLEHHEALPGGAIWLRYRVTATKTNNP